MARTRASPIETVLEHSPQDISPDAAGVVDVLDALLDDVDALGEELPLDVVGRAIGTALGRDLGERVGSEFGEWMAARVEAAIEQSEKGSVRAVLTEWLSALKRWLRNAVSEARSDLSGTKDRAVAGVTEVTSELAEEEREIVERIEERFDVGREEAMAVFSGEGDASESAGEGEETDESKEAERSGDSEATEALAEDAGGVEGDETQNAAAEDEETEDAGDENADDGSAARFQDLSDDELEDLASDLVGELRNRQGAVA